MIPLMLLASLATPFQANAQHADDAGGCHVIDVPVTDPVPPSVEAPLTFAVAFDPNVTAAQRAVINRALDEWRGVVLDAGHILNPYVISFANGPLARGRLASAQTFWNSSSGVLLNSIITIDDDGTSDFFIDPTPAANEEFDARGDCIDAACMDVADLLTVIRHEIGHALGWTGAFGTTNPLTATYVSGTTFDAPRLNIALDPALTSHSDDTIHPDDLMNPTLPGGKRRGLAWYPSVALLGRNIDHDLRLRFVDASSTAFFAFGTGDLPYRSIAAAFAAEPAGRPLLLADGTYLEAPITLDQAHEIFAARQSAIVR